MKYYFTLIAMCLLSTAGCGKPPEALSGASGAKGDVGAPGPVGAGCTVSYLALSPLNPYGGALVTCGNAGVMISNGPPGPQGIPGPTISLGITSIIHPCPNDNSPHREVFLLLSSGDLVWDFSDNISGLNTRLSLAVDGTFQDTDGTGCVFTISTSGNTRTITSSGGSQSWTIN